MDSSAVTVIGEGMQLLAGLSGHHSPVHGTQAALGGDVGNLFFFYEIKEFVNNRIDSFSEGLLNRMMSRVGSCWLGRAA